MRAPDGQNPGSCGILCSSFSLGVLPLCVFRRAWVMSAFHPFHFSGKLCRLQKSCWDGDALVSGAWLTLGREVP